MSTTTAAPPVGYAAHPMRRSRRAARRRHYATEVAAALFSVVVLIWTIAPIYNMVMVAFESEGDVFSEHIWPPKASGHSFWIVITQG